MKAKKDVMLESVYLFVHVLILSLVLIGADVAFLILLIETRNALALVLLVPAILMTFVMIFILILVDVFDERRVMVRNFLFIVKQCNWSDVKNVYVVYSGMAKYENFPDGFIVISDGIHKFPKPMYKAHKGKDVFNFVYSKKKLEMVKKYWHGEIEYVTLDELYLRLGQLD